MQTLTIPASISKRKQACRACRQKKKKCDAEQPSCSSCRKLGCACVYTAQTARREHDIVNNVQPSEGCAMGAPMTLNVNLELAAPGSVPDIDFTTSLPGAPNYLQFYPTPDSAEKTIVTGDNSDHSGLLENFLLPSSKTLVQLVEIFFDNLYHMFPCFHRKSFMIQVQSGFLQRDSPLILYGICCVTARYHPDISVKQRQKDWYEQAKFYYDVTHRLPHCGLRTVQAAMLLIFYAWTCGDYSSSWLFLGKAWRQVVALHMNAMDSENGETTQGKLLDNPIHGDQLRSLEESQVNTAVEKEECRRTLWLLFLLDRSHAWPTGFPQGISEKHFKIDLPFANVLFQNMDPELHVSPHKNLPFMRNLDKLIVSLPEARSPLNIFHYIIIAHILLGRVSELVHSLHSSPNTPEYAEECSELDSYLVRFRMAIPQQASSVFEAAPEDRAHVIWLQVILNSICIMLNYRSYTSPPTPGAPVPVTVAIAAAQNTAQLVKDASRISIDLLISAHVGSSLYLAACVILSEWRLTGEPALRERLRLFELVFDRMDEVFVFLGLKFKIALEHEMKRSKEEVQKIRNGGFKALLTDCSKWKHVKDEAERRGLGINLT